MQPIRVGWYVDGNADMMSGRADESGRIIAPIKRETFSNLIVTNLRRAIISGEIEGGTQITESNLASHFQVSRGPLREALAQLASEGLIVTVPFTGSRVLKLSVGGIRELYTLRTALESLAFKEAWPKRNADFTAELKRRHRALMATLDLDDRVASSAAEVHFHSLIYEVSGHALLIESWERISARLQVYLALHQRAHRRMGPVEDAHETYMRLALGDDLDAMLREIEDHMRRGISQLAFYVSR